MYHVISFENDTKNKQITPISSTSKTSKNEAEGITDDRRIHTIMGYSTPFTSNTFEMSRVDHHTGHIYSNYEGDEQMISFENVDLIQHYKRGKSSKKRKSPQKMTKFGKTSFVEKQLNPSIQVSSEIVALQDSSSALGVNEEYELKKLLPIRVYTTSEEKNSARATSIVDQINHSSDLGKNKSHSVPRYSGVYLLDNAENSNNNVKNNRKRRQSTPTIQVIQGQALLPNSLTTSKISKTTHFPPDITKSTKDHFREINNKSSSSKEDFRVLPPQRNISPTSKLSKSAMKSHSSSLKKVRQANNVLHYDGNLIPKPTSPSGELYLKSLASRKISPMDKSHEISEKNGIRSKSSNILLRRSFTNISSNIMKKKEMTVTIPADDENINNRNLSESPSLKELAENLSPSSKFLTSLYTIENHNKSGDRRMSAPYEIILGHFTKNLRPSTASGGPSSPNSQLKVTRSPKLSPSPFENDNDLKRSQFPWSHVASPGSVPSTPIPMNNTQRTLSVYTNISPNSRSSSPYTQERQQVVSPKHLKEKKQPLILIDEKKMSSKISPSIEFVPEEKNQVSQPLIVPETPIIDISSQDGPETQLHCPNSSKELRDYSEHHTSKGHFVNHNYTTDSSVDNLKHIESPRTELQNIKSTHSSYEAPSKRESIFSTKKESNLESRLEASLISKLEANLLSPVLEADLDWDSKSKLNLSVSQLYDKNSKIRTKKKGEYNSLIHVQVKLKDTPQKKLDRTTTFPTKNNAQNPLDSASNVSKTQITLFGKPSSNFINEAPHISANKTHVLVTSKRRNSEQFLMHGGQYEPIPLNSKIKRNLSSSIDHSRKSLINEEKSVNRNHFSNNDNNLTIVEDIIAKGPSIMNTAPTPIPRYSTVNLDKIPLSETHHENQSVKKLVSELALSGLVRRRRQSRRSISIRKNNDTETNLGINLFVSPNSSTSKQ